MFEKVCDKENVFDTFKAAYVDAAVSFRKYEVLTYSVVATVVSADEDSGVGATGDTKKVLVPLHELVVVNSDTPPFKEVVMNE